MNRFTSLRASERDIGKALVGALSVLIAACTTLAPSTHSTPIASTHSAQAALSKRIVVVATAEEAAHVLGDMNMMLATLGRVNVALARRDFREINQLTEPLRPERTMGSTDPVSVSFHQKIPSDWRRFGKPMHDGWARIAALSAQSKPNVDEIQQTIGTMVESCTGCHATFQLKVAS